MKSHFKNNGDSYNETSNDVDERILWCVTDKFKRKIHIFVTKN